MIRRAVGAVCALGLAWAASGAGLYTVNTGSTPNDLTGDPLRVAFQKLGSNDVVLSLGAERAATGISVPLV